MRRATLADVERLHQFNGRVHAKPPAGFADRIAHRAREHADGSHPWWRAEHVVIVETDAGKLVATAAEEPQTWSFEGVKLGVTRIEFVGVNAARGGPRSLDRGIGGVSA